MFVPPLFPSPEICYALIKSHKVVALASAMTGTDLCLYSGPLVLVQVYSSKFKGHSAKLSHLPFKHKKLEKRI